MRSCVAVVVFIMLILLPSLAPRHFATKKKLRCTMVCIANVEVCGKLNLHTITLRAIKRKTCGSFVWRIFLLRLLLPLVWIFFLFLDTFVYASRYILIHIELKNLLNCSNSWLTRQGRAQNKKRRRAATQQPNKQVSATASESEKSGFR